ncbi:MAG: GNAT family N-acetyltransferase, partial [Pseudomonadota bacterium]
ICSLCRSDSDSNLAVISDKRQLLAISQELSDLMIENADYASADAKRPLYTAAAMAERIDQKNVRSVAVVDPKSKKPIAFLRAYLKEGVGVYMSDFVVAEEHRKNGLGPKIMQAALDSVKDDQEIQNVFLIAGSDHKENSYNKLLGFKSVTEQAQATKLEGGTFMSSLFPAKEILTELPDKLNKPRESVVEIY